jgi:hypothetical protein
VENKMHTTIKIKRRVKGNPGPPESLLSGEMAFNEKNNTLYIGTTLTESPSSTHQDTTTDLGTF